MGGMAIWVVRIIMHKIYCWNCDVGVVFFPQVIKLRLADNCRSGNEFFAHPLIDTLDRHGTGQVDCQLVW